MTVARMNLVDLDVTRYYHCVSRCARGAFLCGEGLERRGQWIEDRIKLLAENFAVSVCGFTVLRNKFHVLVRVDPGVVDTWSDEDAVKRWLAVYPPTKSDASDPKVMQQLVKETVTDKATVTMYRERLQDLSWFMKALKEPLSRMANKEDGCKGAFWEGRYKTIAILDEEALLATCAFVDLSQVAAETAATPEASPYTSVRLRVQHAKSKGKLQEIKAAADGSAVASRTEQGHWLCPLEDRSRNKAAKRGKSGAAREGMLDGFSLGNYLVLIDYTNRLCRDGKARVSPKVAGVLERLGISAELWEQHQTNLSSQRSRLLGSYFATDRVRLRELAEQRGVHHLNNLVAIPDSDKDDD